MLFTRLPSQLERAVEEQPESPSGHSNLGWAYAALGRKEEAIREGKTGRGAPPDCQGRLDGAVLALRCWRRSM